MIRTVTFAGLIAIAAPQPVFADEDDHGTLNPPEMGIASVLQKAGRGETSMMVCASGYYITKKGDHEDARRLFEACAKDGWTGAMTWMGQLEDNGLGRPEDAEAAAEWDRRAAEAGDPVGKFNYGLDLMRGRGVPANEALGRQFVDDAARDGLGIAKRLQDAGYDLDEVTPDADNWKYVPVM